ncbi:MAG: TenA family protein [Burkholderiales bacterium]|jgi:thiaminase/transcriptional activator TenA|nr:TenA family protein [Burkholderiales bacterium]
MQWSTRVWQETLPVYRRILAHPFLLELQNGTLSRDRFLFYIHQDAIYLNAFGKALSVIAAKLSRPEHSEAFLGFAKDCIAVERALHQSYTGDASHAGIAASPSCLLYTSYVLRCAYESSTAVAAAAVLPCFWIYREVGHALTQTKTPDNPYQSWLDTYGGASFDLAVKTAISICDTLAQNTSNEERAAMSDAFILCAKMEWLFWDSAYRQEAWMIA